MANAIHMTADFRRLCDIDAEAFDNIAELTAAMNDDGRDHIFDGFLSRIGPMDSLMVLSVGGGTAEVSKSIVNAIGRANAYGARVWGIVGPAGGYTAEHGDIVILIPAPLIGMTPHTEAFQAVIWHCLVSHPLLQKRATKW